MRTKLIDIKGWDIIVKKEFFYFQRINDEYGKDISYHKSDLRNILTISEAEFNEIKYGVNYKMILSLLDFDADANYSVKITDDLIICTSYLDYFFYLFDKGGRLKEKRDDIGFDSIYSFDLDKNGDVWFAIPTANYIGQFSLSRSQEVFHLGEKYVVGKPLTFPEDIKIYDDFAFISDMENHRIIRLNIETKEWTNYLSFDEPTWEYRQYKDKEIVRIQSGIYLVER